MTVRYHHRGGRLTPDYICDKEYVEHAEDVCQPMPGGGLDEAVDASLVQSVTPLALQAALPVQSEIQARLAESRSPAPAAITGRPVRVGPGALAFHAG